MMVKILNLIFDGVLHYDEVYFHSLRGIYVNTLQRTFFKLFGRGAILQRILQVPTSQACERTDCLRAVFSAPPYLVVELFSGE